MCCYRSRVVFHCFKTLDISQSSERHTWGVVGFLVTVLLQIFVWFWQRNSFVNRLTVDKVKAYKKTVPNFFGPPCISVLFTCDRATARWRFARTTSHAWSGCVLALEHFSALLNTFRQHVTAAVLFYAAVSTAMLHTCKYFSLWYSCILI